jgi:hypothetical protein
VIKLLRQHKYLYFLVTAHIALILLAVHSLWTDETITIVRALDFQGLDILANHNILIILGHLLSKLTSDINIILYCLKLVTFVSSLLEIYLYDRLLLKNLSNKRRLLALSILIFQPYRLYLVFVAREYVLLNVIFLGLLLCLHKLKEPRVSDLWTGIFGLLMIIGVWQHLAFTLLIVCILIYILLNQKPFNFRRKGLISIFGLAAIGVALAKVQVIILNNNIDLSSLELFPALVNNIILLVADTFRNFIVPNIILVVLALDFGLRKLTILTLRTAVLKMIVLAASLLSVVFSTLILYEFRLLYPLMMLVIAGIVIFVTKYAPWKLILASIIVLAILLIPGFYPIDPFVYSPDISEAMESAIADQPSRLIVFDANGANVKFQTYAYNVTFSKIYLFAQQPFVASYGVNVGLAVVDEYSHYEYINSLPTDFGAIVHPQFNGIANTLLSSCEVRYDGKDSDYSYYLCISKSTV